MSWVGFGVVNSFELENPKSCLKTLPIEQGLLTCSLSIVWRSITLEGVSSEVHLDKQYLNPKVKTSALS